MLCSQKVKGSNRNVLGVNILVEIEVHKPRTQWNDRARSRRLITVIAADV